MHKIKKIVSFLTVEECCNEKKDNIMRVTTYQVWLLKVLKEIIFFTSFPS